MSKILYVILIAPICLVIGLEIVNFTMSAISGDVSILGWMANHKVLLSLLACFGLIQLFSPFKK